VMDYVRKYVVIACVMLAMISSICAQPSVRGFEPLQSQGVFPQRLQDVVLESHKSDAFNGFLRSMVLEGQVLYGTPLNQYIDSVADVLLQNDFAALRHKLQFYVLKSPVVNAYSTENGVIVVTVGLLAQISNESELAFVLAHEIVHYAEHHISEIRDYKDWIREPDGVTRYLNYHNRTRRQELAADEIALRRYFVKSPYSTKALDGIYDVLLYSDLPLDEIPFPRAEVETEFYRFPDNCFLSNVNPVGARDETIDTLRTHPNVQKRRLAAQRLANQLLASDDGHALFVQPEARFYEIRNLARLECVYLYLLNHQYDRAIYNAFVLRQTIPDNAFLDYATVSAYYGISKHKNYGRVSDAFSNYKEVCGEMQQVSYWLMRSGRKELTILAFRKAWEMMKKHPELSYYSDLASDLMMDIVGRNKMHYVDFCDFSMFANKDSIMAEVARTPSESVNKYQRLQRKKQELIRPESHFSTANYMLVDIHRDSAFAALMREMELQEQNDWIMDAIQDESDLDVKELVVAPVDYDIVSKRKWEKDELTAERCTERLNRHIRQDCDRLNLDVTLFPADDVAHLSTEMYNHYSALCAWKEEYLRAGGMTMLYHQSYFMESVFDALNSRTMLIVSVVRKPYRYMDFNVCRMLILNCMLPYMAPFTIADMALPRYRTTMQISVVDFLNGETLVSQYYSDVAAMSQAYVSGNVYQQLAKLKK